MSSQIDGVHVVTVANGQYQLNENALRAILLDERIRNMPVAVVSVAGAFRGGKSFLLNFFLRYLEASESARKDGSWIGVAGEELTGFSWRGGSEKNTTGILMWPTPFIITTSAGVETAVLLMDTQGTFDSSSTMRDCSTIFALSTLLSSRQIYNLKDNIKEDDLQNLQLFTDYGKLMKNYDGKPFQVLEFLIRDWMNPWEYPYGHEGGDLYLENKFKEVPNQPLELRELRRQIKASFDKVTCFLMPHPGLEISNPAFKGRPGEISDEFKVGVKELASSVFSSEDLSVKMLGGQPLKSYELFNYFKQYMLIFNSDKNPTPKTILAATSEAGILTAQTEAREQYEKIMKQECGPDAPSMPLADVIDIHTRQVAAARVTFRSRKLFGEKAAIDSKLEELVQELNQRQKDYMEINESKTMKAQNAGVAAYDAKIRDLTQGKSICVHAKDLATVHDAALNEAIVAFDEHRKKPAVGRTDAEREKYIRSFRSKYEMLRLHNDQNNKSNASEVKTEYFQQMVVKCNSDPKLSDEDFTKAHEEAMANALAEFDSRRNISNAYTEDPYRFHLKEAMKMQFGQLKQINASGNTKAFQLAMVVYNESTLSVSELRRQCLHPAHLKSSHENAMCNALLAFRPKSNRSCAVGFNKNNEDEAILLDVFKSRFEALDDINSTANQIAVNTAYDVYTQAFDAQVDIFYVFRSWETAKGYHLNALSDALKTFYGKRVDPHYVGEDIYVSDLQTKCKKYYDPNNKS